MKCWECKKQITEAHRQPYVAINQYTGEAYAEKFRDICHDCILALKPIMDPCYHIRVEKLSQRALWHKKVKA